MFKVATSHACDNAVYHSGMAARQPERHLGAAVPGVHARLGHLAETRGRGEGGKGKWPQMIIKGVINMVKAVFKGERNLKI